MNSKNSSLVRSLVLALLCVNVASAFGAVGTARAVPTVCVHYPDPTCAEGSWGSVNYSQTGLEFCVNTLVDSDFPFCPTPSQEHPQPCPGGADEVAIFATRSDAVYFAGDSRAYSFDNALPGETVTLNHVASSDFSLLRARTLALNTDGTCSVTSTGDADGWAFVDTPRTYTLAGPVFVGHGVSVPTRYFLEVQSVAGGPAYYTVGRDAAAAST